LGRRWGRRESLIRSSLLIPWRIRLCGLGKQRPCLGKHCDEDR
jgi:hypothetical protein